MKTFKEWILDLLDNAWRDCKRMHKSWTIQFNALAGVAALALPELISFVPELQAYLPEETYKTGMLIILLVNFLLRFKTSKPMRLK